MTNRTLTRIQAGSGSVFSIFAILHLMNTTLAALGPGVYDGYQSTLRPLYQYPAVELLGLALPLSIHVAAAVVRWRRLGFRFRERSLRSRLHSLSGVYLLLVITGHVVATRGPSLMLGFDPGFAGLAFSLWWQPLVFYPYYLIFSLSALYHTANGLLLALGTFGRPAPSSWRRGPGFWVPLAAMALLLVLGVLGLGGQLYDIHDPTDNDYARMWSGFGVDLGR